MPNARQTTAIVPTYLPIVKFYIGISVNAEYLITYHIYLIPILVLKVQYICNIDIGRNIMYQVRTGSKIY